MAEIVEKHHGQKRSWPSSRHQKNDNWLEFAQQHKENLSPEESTSKIQKLSNQNIDSDSSPEYTLKPDVPEIAEVVETTGEQSDSDDESSGFAHKLSSWAREFKINAKALEELLIILRRSGIGPPALTAEDLLGDGDAEVNSNSMNNGCSPGIQVEICEDLQVDCVRSQDNSDRNHEEQEKHGAQLNQNSGPSTSFERKLDTKLDTLLDNQRLMMASIARLLALDDSEEEDLPSPLRKVYELEKLSEKLQKDPVLRKKMIQRLGSIGGRNIPDCVRQIMKSIGTFELWCKYSYKGRKGKRPLQALYISKIILRACMRRITGSKVTEIELAIGNNLKSAPKRASLVPLERRAIKLEHLDLIEITDD